MSFADDIKRQFTTGTDLTRLIYLNLGVFILMLLVRIIGNIAGGPDTGVQYINAVLNWVALPSDPFKLLTRPWTIITYMFLHVDFFHLFWNLVLLYFTGRIFQEYLGGRRLMAIYIGGGILGALLYFVISNISSFLGENGILLGASAGVTAVLIGLAFYIPHLPVRLFFVVQVQLWQVAAGVFILDLFRVATSQNPGGSLAHIGGAVFGYYLISQLRKGRDLADTGYAYYHALVKAFRPKPKLKKVYSSGKKTTTAGNSRSDQEKLDAILDKIKANGYDKLTKEEKDFLFKFGKK